MLNNPNGNQIACNFPARYNYLKQNNANIKHFNLSECKDLNTFINSFNRDKLSIVFSSEYTNNPSSSFGHTMLLFSSDNQSLNVGDSVHFAAKTNQKDDFFTYAKKGFNGSYNGYFTREPFFKKIYEYNILEQRYMYVYTLNFNKNQILDIIYHLYELRKATFKYYFLNENCSSQITDLLSVVSNNSRKNSIYYLPIQTITDKNSIVTDKTQFIPLINKLSLLIKNMSKEENKIFHKHIEYHLEVNENTPDIVKEAMVYYSSFYFRKYRKVYKNYNSVMEQSYTKHIIKDTSIDPLEKTKPSSIGLGLYFQKNTKFTYLSHRPLLIDIFDVQLNSLQESEVDIFSYDFIINKKDIKLLKFNLFSIKSFPLQSYFYKPMSWSLYSGFNRKNKENGIKFNNEIGFGRSLSLIDNAKINTLFYVGNDNTDIYLKPSVSLTTYLGNSFKSGITSSYKQYSNSFYYLNKVFVTLKHSNFIYQLKYENENSLYSNKLLFSIKYNF